MQCVILAGGLGTRMRPLTETIPKFLLPVSGRPFADYQLTWLAQQGVDRALLLIGYKGELIEQHVGDGSRYGLDVRYVNEGPQLLGTAGAVRLALEHGELDERFLLLYGDSFLPVDLSAVWNDFQTRDARALMTVLQNGDRWDQSNAIYRDGQVELYDKKREHERKRELNFIDYGLSAYSVDVFQGLPAENGPSDLSGILRDLSLAGELAGYEVHERFYEIGSRQGLADFEQYVADHRLAVPPGGENNVESSYNRAAESRAS